MECIFEPVLLKATFGLAQWPPYLPQPNVAKKTPSQNFPNQTHIKPNQHTQAIPLSWLIVTSLGSNLPTSNDEISTVFL